jgi:uptake hydrogenase large subunit
MSRRVIGPFNRVEGDLEISLEMESGRVKAAYVNSPLYRGFEQILQGKSYMDALVIVPRICGICSVSQSAASAMALRSLMQSTPPHNGQLAECLVTACENMADHLTHFYMFFMPDFARAEYQKHTWYQQIASRFTAVSGSANADMLPARASFLRLMGLMAGKWPHTLSLQPGGSARPLQQAEVLQLIALLRNFRNFLEHHLFGDRLEAVTALDSLKALLDWRSHHKSDFGLFLDAALDLQLESIGRATDRFMSYGVYHAPEGILFPAGRWDCFPKSFNAQEIAEDVSHSWMESNTLSPAQGITIPTLDKSDAYSWCKAPRYGGEVYEVGALARQMVAGHPLIRDMVSRHGASVLTRVVARLLELAIVIPHMEKWARDIRLGDAWCYASTAVSEGSAAGLTGRSWQPRPLDFRTTWENQQLSDCGAYHMEFLSTR